jgi:hypothetical protein
MRKHFRFASLVFSFGAAVLAWAATGQAQPAVFLFDLVPPSQFEYGCFGPCACPVLFSDKLSGTMALVGSDVIDPGSPIVRYEVKDVRWEITQLNQSVPVRGSGFYEQTRSTTTPEQRLVLDLSVNGEALQHFDSGVVPGGGSNGIDIHISLHNEFCHDSVFVIHSIIRTTGVDGRGDVTRATIAPNPSRQVAEVRFQVPRAGDVEVRVVDLAGREVNVLARGWRAAGPASASWDGRRSDGSRARPGLYFVRIVAAGECTMIPAVRLQ